MKGSTWLLGLMLLVAHTSAAQCPWHRDIKELQSPCICAYNLGKDLSVQCDMVDFSLLLSALDRYARTIPLHLLYVNNSTVIKLEDGAFKNLKLNNVQLSGCKIRTIAPGTFRCQEGTLRNVNLQDNELEEVLADSLRPLAKLSLLDLSPNRIGRVPDEHSSLSTAFQHWNSLTTILLYHEVTGRRVERRKQLLDKKTLGYWKLKEEALDRTL